MQYVIIGVVIFIVLFLILRELFNWYWKINERISNQNDIKALLKETNSLLTNILNKNFDSKNLIDEHLNIENKSTYSNLNLEKYKQYSNSELFDIIKTNTVKERNDLLTIIGILKKRSSQPPFGYLDKIRKDLNIASFEEFWIEVDKLT